MGFMSIGALVVHGSHDVSWGFPLCCFTWIEVLRFISKLVSPYTTFKQTFARRRIFVPKL